MPRMPRQLLSKSFYHIMTRGNNKNTVFRVDQDFNYFLDLIRKYKKDYPFDLYHYCLMPNHTHFLIQTENGPGFSVFMKKLNLSYYHYYRKHYGWTGHFWQNRYKSQPVGKDGYFIQCGVYIEQNPVRAGLVNNPKNYPYSSYCYYTKNQPNDLITTDFIFNSMGKTDLERQNYYQNLVIDDVVVANYKHRIWGSDNQRYNEAKKIKYHTAY